MSASAIGPSPCGLHADVALRILKRLLQGFAGGANLRLCNDTSHCVGQRPSAFTLLLRAPMQLRGLVTTRGPVLLADAYFRNQMDVEGDLYSALALKGHFEALARPWRDKLVMLLDAWRWPSRSDSAKVEPLLKRLAHRFGKQHTRQSAQHAITFHYDVSNAFYALWLDAEPVGSCAYLKTAQDTLDPAQQNKLAHICAKLRPQRGERSACCAPVGCS